jgi:hypothetical protein
VLSVQFEDFYEEVFEELSKFGTVEEMNVCDNLGDHLVGNVYVKVCPTVLHTLEALCFALYCLAISMQRFCSYCANSLSIEASNLAQL